MHDKTVFPQWLQHRSNTKLYALYIDGLICSYCKCTSVGSQHLRSSSVAYCCILKLSGLIASSLPRIADPSSSPSFSC